MSAGVRCHAHLPAATRCSVSLRIPRLCALPAPAKCVEGLEKTRAVLPVRAVSRSRAGRPAGEYALLDQAWSVDRLTYAGPRYRLQVNLYRRYEKFLCSKPGGDLSLLSWSGDITGAVS